MMKSTPKQRQFIGFLRKQLNIDTETYLDILQSYGVDSSKDLTRGQAEELLQSLKCKAAEIGAYKSKTGSHYTKYNNMSGRYGMWTPAQLRKIDAMWKNISNQPTDTAKEKALNSFIERITGKKRLSFLTQNEISKVIKAIQVMEQNQKEKIKNG